MADADTLHQGITPEIDHDAQTMSPPFQHQWPLLGQELFALEHALTEDGESAVSDRESKKKQEKIRSSIITQIYNSGDGYARDTVYLAFLLLRQGRGGAIVGDPRTLTSDGSSQELPYTGLEGYFAGSEQAPERPGLSKEEIILEEANTGVNLLQSMKKRAIAHGTWAKFLHLQHVLVGEKPGLEDLRAIQLLWSMIVRQLHVRVYHNREFEPTLSEQIENTGKLLNSISARTEEGKRTKVVVRAEYERLKREYANMSSEEKEQEKQKRRKREQIRADRLEEFNHFRDETYQMLAEAGRGQYTLGVQDVSLKNATITEVITLPKVSDRHTYLTTYVNLTPEQLEGYLFLARLGIIGGNPLVRSPLVSQ